MGRPSGSGACDLDSSGVSGFSGTPGIYIPVDYIQQVNINQAHCRSNGDSTAVNIFHLEVQNLDQLQGVMRAIQRIKGLLGERMRF